jgi:hypothetical protein
MHELEGVPENWENWEPPHVYGNAGTYKNRRIFPWHNALGFFSWGDLSKYT